MSRVINFNAGPAAIPLPALERAQAELLDFAHSGMSVMEHSHRGKEYEAVHHEAMALLRSLAGIPESHDILFLQGGASGQFALIPLNFLPAGRSADYVLTGVWGEKAFAEAKTVGALSGGAPRLAGTTGTGEGKEKTYVRVPAQAELKLDPSAAYLHVTSNETIHGVEYALPGGVPFPTSPGVPVICDMSSDFMGRRLELSQFDFIYAGAQKNVGPSGVVVVIAKKEFLAQGRKDLPKIFQYRVHDENESLYHTPPTFGIYLVRNVLSWMQSVGGLAQIEAWNQEKARLLYGAIDAHAGFYRCPVHRDSRSIMNVVFRLPSEALEEKFVSEAKKLQMVGIKGHRSVGGIRVSLYNAVTVDWVRTLVGFMNEFVRTNG